MIPKKRLLFLYMAPGTGHQKAAEAIIKSAMHMNPKLDCVALDGGNQAYPLLNNVFNRMYLQLIQRAPAVWDYLYDNPDVEEATREMRQLLTMFSTFRTRKILKAHHPQAVVCTQAIPVIAMAAQKRSGYLKSPLIGVVTDFGAHAYWYHPEVDLYLVGHEDIKREMVHKGIAADRIRVTGIPIDPRFGESSDPTLLKNRLHLPLNKKTVLVMGGSHGLGSLDEVVQALSTIPMNLNLLVVCGKNRRLQRKMVKMGTHNIDLHVFGYVRDISLLMGASDLIVTKPGGLSSSEAIAKQIPLVLTNPIPGQEEKNVHFLTRHGAARVARTMEDLIHNVSDLLRHPKKLATMRHRARIIGKPYAAWEAARSIFLLLNGQPRP